jgi:hypothetical protein
MENKLKKKLFCTEMDFQKRAARTSRLLKVRNKVAREKMELHKLVLKEWKKTC